MNKRLHIEEEAARCLLCADAPCGQNAACAVRALRFENPWKAREIFDQMTDDELRQAESACIHYDRPIRLTELKKSFLNVKLPTPNFKIQTPNLQ